MEAPGVGASTGVAGKVSSEVRLPPARSGTGSGGAVGSQAVKTAAKAGARYYTLANQFRTIV